MSRSVLDFAALLFTALAFVSGAAHALELPNKIRLRGSEYWIAQKLYRGWQWVGVLVVAALVSTAALAVSLRGEPRAFGAALVAVLCILTTQAIFWAFTFPVNQATANWTAQPSNWMQLRKKWEYSHAASAALNLLALVAVALAVVGS